jgi:hypothetical protein
LTWIDLYTVRDGHDGRKSQRDELQEGSENHT